MRGMGDVFTDEGEAKLFWWGGGEAHRRKREREWDERGWEEWEVEGEQLNGAATNDIGGDSGGIVEGEVDGVNVEGNGGNVGDVGEGGGREMDGEGNVGQVKEGALAEGGSLLERKPLRGGRRVKKSKMSEGEKEKLALYMAKWLGRGPT